MPSRPLVRSSPLPRPTMFTHPDSRRKHRLAVNASWLLRLRWVAVVGQLATIACAALLYQVALPLAELLTIVGLTAASNAAVELWLREQIRREEGFLFGRYGDPLLALIMAVDLAALTGLLYYTGGPANPFIVFYFVNLALAAVVLPARWSWCLTAIAAIGVAGVFYQHRPLPALEAPAVANDPGGAAAGVSLTARADSRALRRQGLLLGVIGGACVIVYFITRVARELEQREQELREAEQRRQSARRWEALATLAAGAGHELASPLSTIAVIATDLSRHLEGTNAPDSVREDVALIRSELEHCRAILNRMSGRAGRDPAEQLASVSVQQVVEQVLEGVRNRGAVRVRGAEPSERVQLVVPLEGLAQAIRGVVQNALDASAPEQSVELQIDVDAAQVVFRVIDQGEGMSATTLQRAGEPFFTTKEPGQGMGLGLFLTRNVIERLGGSLQLTSNPDEGTTACIRLPRPTPAAGGSVAR